MFDLLKRYGLTLVILFLVGTAFYAWLEPPSPEERIFIVGDTVDGVEKYLTVRVPPSFTYIATRGVDGVLRSISVAAPVTEWSNEAKKHNCSGDLDKFVSDNLRFRNDLRAHIAARIGPSIEDAFESAISRTIEEKIVSRDSDDPNSPRKFLKVLSLEPLSYADCYYDSAPHYYCRIRTGINSVSDGILKISKGSWENWPNHLPIMKCVLNGMIVSASPGIAKR